MKEISIAMAVVGVAASLSYCAVHLDDGLSEQRNQEIRLCYDSGGVMRSGWNGRYCEKAPADG